MVDVLPNLHHCSPRVRCELLLAVIALGVGFNEFRHEGLFDFSLVIELLFDSDFDFDSFGVLFCPDEARIDNLGSIQSLNFLEEYREQFFAITLACDPWWSHVSMAEATEIDDSLLGNANCDISFG